MRVIQWTAAVVFGGLSCCAAMAQQNAPKAEKPVQLTPMLDKSVMDTTVDPCVDFYKFACGNWSKQHPMPADQPDTDQFQNIDEFNQRQLRAILDEAAAAKSADAATKKLGDYYASCMDDGAIEAKSPAVLRSELDRINSVRDKSEMLALVAHYQLIGVNAFFGFGSETDLKDATRKIAVVGQGGLGLPERDYYLRTGADDEKIRQLYLAHLERVLTLAGDATPKASAAAVLKLETELAKVSLDVTSMRDPHKVYHPMKVSELAALTPGFDWPQFFQLVGAPSFDVIDVNEPDYFKGILQPVGGASLETLKSYLRVRLVDSMSTVAMPKAYDDESFNFAKLLTGQAEQSPRWKRCSRAADGALGEVLGKLYVERNFAGDSKQKALEMIHDLEAAVQTDIESLDWMSAPTKQKALEKLKAIANNIGYPEKWRDYSKLEVVRGEALANSLRSREFSARREIAKIGQAVDRSEWDMTPPTVNAYYDASKNDINFPAGILQSAFFDAKAPAAQNYGHMGAVVGHEITHGFDDQGAQFDGQGNMRDWWTKEDAAAFKQRTQCLVDEYSQFKVGDVKVNGELTLGENTADNGGLRVALLAYLARAARESVNVNATDSTGYTPMQQFFLGYAQDWCSEWRPELERLVATTDPHSPSRFRANGALVNLPDFGKAFHCKAGQPMTPAKTCRVW